MVYALEALVNPKRHPLQLRWVLDQKAKLNREIWREIRTLSFAFKTWQLGMFSPSPEDELTTFAEELERLRTMPLETFAADVARAFTPDDLVEFPTGDAVLHDRTLQAALVAEATRLNLLYEQPALQLVRQPDALRERLIAMLSAFWGACFQAEWERIEPVLVEDVVAKGVLLDQADLYAFFRQVLPGCRIQHREQSLLFRKDHEATVDLESHPSLLLVPSCFTWGRTRVECDPPWAPALIYPAGYSDLTLPPTPIRSMPGLFAALAHETRLHILGLCWSAPRSTQELARLLGLTESGVSRHLNILQEAGFVEGRRNSYYVLYRTAQKRLWAISPLLAKRLQAP